MGDDDDQAIVAHAKKDRSKREDQPQRKPKRFQKNQRSKNVTSPISNVIHVMRKVTLQEIVP